MRSELDTESDATGPHLTTGPDVRAEETVRALQRLERRTTRLHRLEVALGIALCICALLLVQSNTPNALFLGEWLALMALLAGSHMTRRALWRTARQMQAAEDPGIIGALALTLTWIHEGEAPKENEERRQMEGALARLLPRVKPEVISRLDHRQAQALYHNLGMSRVVDSEALLLAILAVLERTLDIRAMRQVRQLASAEAITPGERRVRAAAQRVLPLLEERATLERESRTLLHPADAPADPSETLLRPAGAASETDNRLLLRPGAKEGSDGERKPV